MSLVDVKVHQQVATIKLDRADAHNALSPLMIEELMTAFSDVHQERRVSAVVLIGAGKHFCSGIDLRVLDSITQLPPPDRIGQWITLWRDQVELLETMLRFPKPIVAAVDGAAIGSGLSLALAADMLLPSREATFVASAVRRGLVGGATAALLNFRGGGATAARLLLTGEPVDSAEAYRLGLCLPPVASEQIWVAACDLARRCGESPREAVQATKRLLNESIGETLMTQLAAAAADSATACSTEAAAEGVAAFVQRREPNWP